MPATQTDRLNGLTTSVAVKAPCKAVSTVALTLFGEQTVNGVACVAGDRVLYALAGGSVDNGIWVVSTGTWSRSADFDGNRDVVQGTMVIVASSSDSDTLYRVTTANPITIGVSSITFVPAGLADSANSSFLQAGAGAVARTARDKMRDIVSAKDFGAVGDGITDDTAAIQAALDFVSNTTFTTLSGAYAKGGGSVFLPPGSYRITATLRVGANTKLYGFGPVGATMPSVTTNTGAILVCDFPGAKQAWAISSATYTAPSGVFATYLQSYSGVDVDSGLVTLTHGIEISGLVIKGNGIYGGIRLLASSGFHVHDCMVYDVGVAYRFNASYGGQYEKLHGLFSIYGLVIQQCNAIAGGHAYMDKISGAWTIDASTRLVSTYDMDSTAYMPTWINKSFAFYVEGCIGISLAAHTGEHANIGSAFSNVSNLSFSGGYFEGNTDSNMGFVTTSGVVSTFANATTGGTKYHFGVNNNIDLNQCSIGAIYVGHAQNTVRVTGGSGVGAGATDWSWSDVITFTGLETIRVSATGSVLAVLGYTTLDEAIRRIGASSHREWVIKIKDGDTVATTAQRSIAEKNIRIEREGAGTAPTISVGAAGGGYINRISLTGRNSIRFVNVNMTFPGVASVAGDSGLFFASGTIDATICIEGGTLSMGSGYSLFQVYGAMRLDAIFQGITVTATVAAPLLVDAGGSLTSCIQTGSTVAAGIRALGTNGWQGTVLSSNLI